MAHPSLSTQSGPTTTTTTTTPGSHGVSSSSAIPPPLPNHGLPYPHLFMSPSSIPNTSTHLCSSALNLSSEECATTPSLFTMEDRMLLKLMYHQQQIIQVQLNSIFSWMQLTSSKLSYLERVVHELQAQCGAMNSGDRATGIASDASVPLHTADSTLTTLKHTAEGMRKAQKEDMREYADLPSSFSRREVGRVNIVHDPEPDQSASPLAYAEIHAPMYATALHEAAPASASDDAVAAAASTIAVASTSDTMAAYSQNVQNSNADQAQRRPGMNAEPARTTSVPNTAPRSCTPSPSRGGRKHTGHGGASSSDAVLNHSVDSLAAPWDPRNRLPGQLTSLRSSRTGSQLGRQDNPLLTGMQRKQQQQQEHQLQLQRDQPQHQHDPASRHHSSSNTTQLDEQAQSLHSVVSLATSGPASMHSRDIVTANALRPSRRHSDIPHSASHGSHHHTHMQDSQSTQSYRVHHRSSTNRLRSVGNSNSSSSSNVNRTYSVGGSGYMNDSILPGSSSSTLVSSLRYAERDVPPYLRVAVASGTVNKSEGSQHGMPSNSSGSTVRRSSNYVDTARHLEGASISTGPQKVSALLTRKTVHAAVSSGAAITPQVSAAAATASLSIGDGQLNALHPARHVNGSKKHEQQQQQQQDEQKSTQAARTSVRDENSNAPHSSTFAVMELSTGSTTRHAPTGRALENVTYSKVESDHLLKSSAPVREKDGAGAADVRGNRERESEKYKTDKNDARKRTTTRPVTSSPLPLHGDPFQSRELHPNQGMHDGDEVATTTDCLDAFSYDSLSDGYGSYESKQYLKGIGLL